MEIGRWNGHIFEVSHKKIKTFSEFNISKEAEIEDKDSGGQKYSLLKSKKPTGVQMTIILNAYLGCDVRDEAMAILDDVGKKDYMYIGNQKLISSQMMLRKAMIDKVEMAPGGQWIRAEVQIDLSQSGKESDFAKKSGGGRGKKGTPQKESVKAVWEPKVKVKRYPNASEAIAKIERSRMHAKGVSKFKTFGGGWKTPISTIAVK